MKYPNIKPKQGEQRDINQRRYPPDTIELAGPRDQQAVDKAGENVAIPQSQPSNRKPVK